MENKPFISALIVTRNEAFFTQKAVLSLINQTYPQNRYEIIIVDGESSDNTLKIVSELIQKYKSRTFDIRVIE